MKTNNERVLKIIDIVNKMYGIDCRQNTRRREVVIPRQIAMYFIYKNVKVSSPCVGRYFKRDHATVLYAVKVVENIIESRSRDDKVYKEEIAEMRQDIKKHLELSDHEVTKLNVREDIIKVIESYNLLGLNNLRSQLIINPN
jgi:hypothetical protein